jgi:outer membrane lipoprotein-sorting protein
MRSLFALLSLFLFVEPAFAGDPEALLKNIKPSWKKVSDYTCEIKIQQRVDGKLYDAQLSIFKFRKPSDMYAKRLNEPNKGAEALWRGASWNEGKIKGNKGSFPNISVSIDPYAKLALIDQNHPMPHFSMGFFIDMMLSDFNKARTEGVDAIKEAGADTVDGRACTKVSFSTNPKAGTWYTPQKKDTWLSIAKANNSDFTMVRYNNPDKKPHDTSAKIWIPTYYASKWEICVDDASGLPIAYQSWDAAGNIFEIYSYTKLKLNVGLTDIDFDPDNENYNY